MHYTEQLRKILTVEYSKSDSPDLVQEICNSPYIEQSLEWLMNSPEYRGWRQTSTAKLLIHGERGDGKTVAMSYVLKSLRLVPQFIQERDIVFIFCSHGDSGLGMVASLACQLLRNNITRAKAARKNVPISKFESQTQTKAIWELLRCSIVAVDTETIFLIDGIDKLDKRVRSSFLHNFRRIEKEIEASYKPSSMLNDPTMIATARPTHNTPMRAADNIPMKVLISSETIDDIMSKLAHYLTIDREKERRGTHVAKIGNEKLSN